jgi:hypothetical protein
LIGSVAPKRLWRFSGASVRNEAPGRNADSPE